MIYLIDPIRTLVLSNQNASLDFVFPHLTERFKPVLSSAITGHADISVQDAKVRISGQCTEGAISIEASHPSYILALKKARNEFARVMTLWMRDRYGRSDASTSIEALLEHEQAEAERFRLLGQERRRYEK